MDNTEFTQSISLANQFCLICGKKHNYQACDYIKITKHVPDSQIPSKAKLTVPNFLQLEILTDGSYSVITKSLINKGTQFGPLQAEKVQTLDPANTFPLKIFPSDENGNSEYYLDVADENKCSWLIFVSPAEHEEEQNLICYQENEEIYYITVKDIPAGDTLKVWYAPYYASKMNKSVLTSKAEIDPSKDIDISTLIKKQQNIMERKVWTCKFCSQMENDIVLFAKHILKHYTAQLKKMCEICKKSFSSKKSLKSHLKIVHRSCFPTTQPKPVKTSELSAKTHCKDVALGGPLLNDIFTDSSDLQQTDLNQFALNIDNQNLLLDSDNLIVENLLNENVKDLDHFNFEIDDNQKQFVCDICLKQFTKVKLLIIHLRHHTGDFMCSKCLKIFCRKENLLSHTCNLSSRQFCSLCDKSFTQRKYLSRHLEAVHNKKFNCVSCNKFYYSNKELLEHNCSKVPLTEKEKFMCPLCDKEFYRDIYLKKHLKTHTSRTKSTKGSSIICEVCGLSLETRNSYYLHKKKHNDPSYACQICNRKFYRQDTLKTHVLGHQITSKVECNICNKKFKTKKILRSHIKYHHDNIPHRHKCTFCEANFKQRAALNRHLKNHENNKNKRDMVEYYNCPVCYKSIKLKSSLLRHLRKLHSGISNIDLSCIKPKLYSDEQSENKEPESVADNNNKKTIPIAKTAQTKDDLCNDLISNTLENDLDDQINNLLTSAENNLSIHKQAVESLVQELDLSSKQDVEEHREVCLSIPDLTEADQEITLDKNAYILDNGTIVQPQGDSDNVVIYVLDQTY